MSTITTRAGKGSPLTNTEVDNNFTNLNDDKLENVSEDTTPQLGGDLDLNSNDITGTGNIDVTGTVTADGLTVEGSTDVALITTNRPTYTEGLTLRNTLNWGYGASLSFDSITSLNGSNGEVGRIQSTWISTGYHGLDFYVFNNNSLSRQMRIAGNGDISFYDDAGTSQDFYWDASTSRLGLGTTSPTTELQTVGQIVGGTSGFGSNMVGFTGLGSFNSSTAVENIDALYLRKNGTDASSVSIALASAGGDSYYVGSRIKHIRSGSNSNGHLTFETKSDSSTNTTTERMRITDAGNVGIGTTSPQEELDISSTNPAVRLSDTTTSGLYHRVVSSSNNLYLESDAGNVAASSFIGFRTDGVEHMRLTSDSRLGIGTTSPSQKLHLDYGSNVGTGSGEVATKMTVAATYVSAQNEIRSGVTSGTNPYMSFAVREASSPFATVERMRITQNGNVGIGTTSPEEPLTVQSGLHTGTVRIGADVNAGTLTNATQKIARINAPHYTNAEEDMFVIGTSCSSNANILYLGGSSGNHNAATSIQFYTAANHTTTTGSEAARIDSNGRLGIGTTSPVRTLHVTGGNDTIRLESTGANTKIEMVNTTSSTNEFGFLGANFFVSPNGSEAMRIDSSGKVGIGTTSPNRNLHVIGNATIEATTGNSAFLFIPTDTDNRLYSRAGNASTTPLPLTFFMGGSEAARIDSSGNLLVGTTNNTQYAVTDGGDAGLCYRANASLDISRQDGDVTNFNRLGSDGKIVKFRKDGTTVGSISVTSSATTYNTTSDARLKTSIEPIADATDRLMRMNPVSHKWIDNPEAGSVVGFIAQEMQSIVPEAVSGTPDGEEMMAMDYGRITPVLVAALQEALTRIESLENQISNLTGGS